MMITLAATVPDEYTIQFSLFLFFTLFLIVRLLSFHKLTTNELPRANRHDLQEMRGASKSALLAFVVSAVFNIYTPKILAFLRLEHDAAARSLLAVSGIGFIAAWVLDLKAEIIKKRCRDPAQSAAAAGEIRWYHFLFAVFLPFLAFPWGLVDLFRKRFASGWVLILIPTLMGYLVFRLAAPSSRVVLKHEQTASSRPVPNATPVKIWTEAEAKAEAVRRYPQLSIANSPMNRAFLARYQQKKASDPAFLRDPAWPLRLAEEVAP